jgi:hypothetical protein
MDARRRVRRACRPGGRAGAVARLALAEAELHAAADGIVLTVGGPHAAGRGAAGAGARGTGMITMITFVAPGGA